MAAGAADRHARLEACGLLAPAAVLYGVFVLLPLAGAVAMSLADLRSGAAEWTFTFTQYRRVVADPVFWRALAHNLFLLAASLLVQIPAAFGLALFLARLARGRALRGFLRAGYFVPMMLPTAAIGWIWFLLLDPVPEAGALSAVLHGLGVDRANLPHWLGSGTLALPTLIFVISWRYIGFHMVILLAGLVSIPQELYEAARVDGAGDWQCFRYVTLPQMARPLGISAMLAIVGSLRYFDLVYIMTGGGPAHASELVATYMYKSAFAAGEYSYAAALAVFLTVISLAVTGTARWMLRRGSRSEAGA